MDNKSFYDWKPITYNLKKEKEKDSLIIYLLKLEENKYYVGKTKKIKERILDHTLKKGSAWTKKYKPIKVKKIYENVDDYDEDKYTLKAMKKYGIENVRGGSFVQVVLSKEKLDVIKLMINGAKNKCFNCGGNHFIRFCKQKKMTKAKEIKKDNVALEISNPSVLKKKCEKCNRIGHTSDKCYAKTIKKVASDLKNNKTIPPQSPILNVDKNNSLFKCNRCGRIGHFLSACSMKTHVKGHYLPKNKKYVNK